MVIFKSRNFFDREPCVLKHAQTYWNYALPRAVSKFYIKQATIATFSLRENGHRIVAHSRDITINFQRITIYRLPCAIVLSVCFLYADMQNSCSITETFFCFCYPVLCSVNKFDTFICLFFLGGGGVVAG